MNRREALKFASRLVRVENVLQKCIEKIIDEQSFHIDAMALLIGAYAYQKGNLNQLFIQRYIDIDNNSKFIRQCSSKVH